MCSLRKEIEILQLFNNLPIGKKGTCEQNRIYVNKIQYYVCGRDISLENVRIHNKNVKM